MMIPCEWSKKLGLCIDIAALIGKLIDMFKNMHVIYCLNLSQKSYVSKKEKEEELS